MKNTNNSVRNLVLSAVAKTVKGTTFVGIRAYKNKQGEVSNQTLLVGINYENVLIHDFKILKEKQSEIFETLAKDKAKNGELYTVEMITEAYNKVYNTLEKRLSDETTKEVLRAQGDKTIIASDAQADAYEHIAKGVKRHLGTGELHIFGLCVNKTILEAIEFKQDKYKNFKFDSATIKLQGIEL